MRGLVVAGVAALAVIPVAPVSGATKKPPPDKKVTVADDYFQPLKMKVPRGTRIVWKWLPENGNTHDVKLKKAPKGVKKFQSDPAAAYYTYKKRLKVKGTYFVICTFHENMTQTITVR